MVCRLTIAAPHASPPSTRTCTSRSRSSSAAACDFIVEGRARIGAGRRRAAASRRTSAHGATMLDEEVVLIDIFSPPREDFLPRPDGTAVTAMPFLDAFKLDGKVALVTGASRGLGAAMAVALASAGAEVALHSNEQPATATAAKIGADSGRAHGALHRRSRRPRRRRPAGGRRAGDASAASTSWSTTPASSAATPPRSTPTRSGTR